MKKNHIINQTKENVTAKVKTFFAILAKMEWLSFILFGPSLVRPSLFRFRFRRFRSGFRWLGRRKERGTN